MAVVIMTSGLMIGCKRGNAGMEAALQGLLDQQVEEQDILGMAMAVRLADGTVIGLECRNHIRTGKRNKDFYGSCSNAAG